MSALTWEDRLVEACGSDEEEFEDDGESRSDHESSDSESEEELGSRSTNAKMEAHTRRNFDQPFSANTGIVYKITSPSGKAYVGQTRKKLMNRMSRHRDLKWGRCTIVKRAIKKYGWDKMKVEVLWSGPADMLDSKEVEFIAAHGTLAPDGYNATVGGDANPMSSVIGRQSVKDSWADPNVRSKHTSGLKSAWTDPVKRSNILNGRAKSANVAKAKAENKHNSSSANAKRTMTWEAKREARLAGLEGKQREQRLARLNRDRERARKKAEAKRTAS